MEGVLLKTFRSVRLFLALAICIFALPAIAGAHEVYVLGHDTIARALQAPPLQAFSIIYTEESRFFFWAFVVLLTLAFVGFVSVSKPLEARFDPFLLRFRRYAPFIGRITLGLSILASAYYGAMFGPELPMSLFLSDGMILPFRIFLAIMGGLLMVGLFTRTAALLMMCAYGLMIVKFSYYMLTYLNYFGEMIIAFTLGSRVLALDAFFPEHVPNIFRPIVDFAVEHGFFMLRIAFGTSLIFAAIYAKFFHAQLAIDTVVQYHLTDYFHFDPPFLVLGAFAIELLLGILFLVGIEIRFAAIFLGIFLTMSLLYFGEAVWPHIILIGGAATIFAAGYGRFTLERQYLNRRHHKTTEEPVL